MSASKKPKRNLSVDIMTDYVTANTPLTAETIKADLTAIGNQCRQAISEPAKLGLLLKRVDYYKENLTEEQFSHLESLADILLKDLSTFSNSLSEIVVEQDELFKTITDVSELQITSIAIHNNYVNWTEQFTHVVLPISGELTGMMTLASNNANAKDTTTNV